jgi:hypothetical protein
MTEPASTLLIRENATSAHYLGRTRIRSIGLKTGSDRLRRGIQGQAAETLAGLPVAAAGSIPLFAPAR